jgi:hypothetical protein
MSKSNNELKNDEKGKSNAKTHLIRKESPRRRLNVKRSMFKKIGYALLYYGIIILAASFLYNSTVLAFIGLGLILWGALFSITRSSKYINMKFFDSVNASLLMAIDEALREMKYAYKGVYLPPQGLEDFKDLTLLIPNKEMAQLGIESIIQGKAPGNPHGMYITPPGQGLLALYEEEMGTDFSRTALNDLEDNMAKVLIEKLEILEKIEITIHENEVNVKMIGSNIGDLCNQLTLKTEVCQRIGDPLSSSIACVLTKVTSKAVIIEKLNPSSDGNKVDISYRLLA